MTANCRILAALRITGLVIALSIAGRSQARDDNQDARINSQAERIATIEGKLQGLAYILGLLQAAQVFFQIREHRKK